MQDIILEKLQSCQFNLLLELDRICKRYSIKYFLIDGTALGAYYLGEILPWDDDIDIGMTYANYLKFMEACKSYSNSARFKLRDYHSDPNYGNIFGQFIDLNTRVIQKGVNSDNSRVFIDVHPFIDGYANKTLAKLDYYSFKVLKILLLKKRNPNYGEGIKWRIVGSIAKKIPESLLVSFINKRMTRKNGNDILVKLHGRHVCDYIFKSNQSCSTNVLLRGKKFPLQIDAKRMLDDIYGEFNPHLNEENRHEYIKIIIDGETIKDEARRMY